MQRAHFMQRLLGIVPLGMVALAACTPRPSGGGSNGNASGTGGPTASPRSDGATLLFSAFSTEGAGVSAQNPAFSPDGSRVVFTLFRSGYNKGPAELWLVGVDGRDARRLTPVEEQDNVNVPGAAWNAVTQEIVFASDRDEADDLWGIQPDGTGLRRITTHPSPPFWIEPVWSPDGAWIVFEADSEAPTELAQRGTIYKVRADGTAATQLTRRSGEDYDDRLPNWSPDGDRILFQRRLPSEGDGDNWDIYVIDTNGDGLTNVSNARNTFNTDNSWSPDSRWIASSSAYAAGGALLPHANITGFFVPNGDASSPVRVTFSSEREDGAPSVSPDGRHVAFESHRTADEESASDLWIIATPESLLPAAG